MEIQPFKTLSRLAAGQKRSFRRHRVYFRESWSAAWKPADYVTCDSYSRGAMPGGSSATLIYQAGRIKREDANDFAKSTPRLRVGNFVLINVLPSAQDNAEFAANQAGNQEAPKILDQWVGIVVHEQISVGAGQNGETPMDQLLTCRGLEHLLATAMLNGSYSLDANGDLLPRFDTVIPFNDRLRWGQSLIGNRSQGTSEIAEGVNSYVFDGDAETATVWTVHNAVDYLLKLLAPRLPLAEGGEMRFVMGGQADNLKNLSLPRTDVDGMSVLAALNALIDIRRGFGWCLRVPIIELNEDGKDVKAVAPEIHVFSVADAPVTLADATLPANAEAKDMDLSGRIDVVDCRFSIDDRSYYGRINVMGERLLVCAPFSVHNGTLVEGWTPAEQTKYVTAGGPTSLDKDNHRQLDGLRHVFSLLRVPITWDFKAGNWTLKAKHNANPLIKDDGYLDTKQSAPVRGVWGLTFERYIPFFKAPLFSVDARADVREPVVFLFDPDANAWISSDAVPAEVRVGDHELAVQILANPPHLLARDVVNSIDSTAVPKYDYREAQIVAAFRTDQRLRVRGDVPIVARPGETEDEYVERVKLLRERELRIEIPGAEMIYVVPGTPMEVSGALDGLTYGQLVLHAGGTIRNDVAVLRRVYTAARAWFGRPRASASITLRNIEPEPKVGGLIKFLKHEGGAVEVRSVITSQVINLTQQTTTIQTTYLELDFARRNG